MRPIKLKLRGFKGIRSGVGKESISIDFTTAVPISAKIVALKGPNGSGKTTVMDNIHPYRVMPSRAITPTPTSFSFYENIEEEAEKEFEWEHNGIFYRSVLKFKQTQKTKKQECFLFVIKNGQVAPWICLKTGLVSNGKADNYDQAVESILGKPEAFFATQFSAQGKIPIGKMTAGEIKALLSQMMGMEKIAAQGLKAQAVVRELKPHLVAAQDAVKKLYTVKADIENLQVLLNEQKGQHQGTEKERATLREDRDAAYAALGVAKSNAQQREAQKKVRADFLLQTASAKERHSKLKNELVQRQQRESHDLRTQAVQAEQAVSSTERQVQDLQKRLIAIRGLLGRMPQIEVAECERQKLLVQRQELDAVIRAKKPAILKIQTVHKAVADLKAELAKVQAGGQHLASILAQAKATAALLDDVPCKGIDDMAGQCKLLGQAHAASKEIEVVEVKLFDARKAFVDNRSTIHCTEKNLATLEKDASEATQAIEKLAQTDQEIGRFNALLSERPYIEGAQREQPHLLVALEQAKEDLQKLVINFQLITQKVEAKNQSHKKELEQFDAQCVGELERLQQQINTLPVLAKENELQIAEARIQVLNTQEAALSQRQSTIAKAILDTQLKMRRGSEANEELAEAQQKADAIGSEMAEWILLAKAFSTDGIIAMQIDDAGPAISAIANQLLKDCYGGRFQIKLETQTKTQAGILKEAFVIQVEDTHRGEIKPFDLMSGGEKVWINECLVRAVALHIAQASDSKFDTLFADESDGPLDPERKRQYMQMKKSVLDRGGYSREYIITQTPELISLCDAVIDITNI